ncbi:MAG: hypothetical protein N4A46_08310 [Schleiferiaceae bacterium]|jgi:hypothetical protein|nr:hypothetical protein [Schleiferiaceae bacterium]
MKYLTQFCGVNHKQKIDMTFISSTMPTETKTETSTHQSNQAHHDEFTIKVSSHHVQHSEMSHQLKEKVRSESPSLTDLFVETLESKGETSLNEVEWKSTNSVELPNISNLSLHSFALKAEALGKKISYEKTLTVKITD